MPKVTPFLWFDTQAEEAANFYVSVFGGESRVENVSRYGEVGPMPKGTVMTVAFRLHGQAFIALNAGPAFKFNPAVSFSVDCKDQAEIDGYWAKLTADGGKPSRCGWLEDKFGLSWQIVPAGIGDLIKTPKAMAAMMEMGKLDIAALKRAGS